MAKGILVGCDLLCEWLLPWWWERYSEDNDLPVCFADFGMSKRGKKWCEARGIFLPLLTLTKELKVCEKKNIDPNLVKRWENEVTPAWEKRASWFKKPFAFENTPFEETLWLDLDCEVLGNIEEIFAYLADKTIALYQQSYFKNDEDYFNSGVVCFRKNARFIPLWRKSSLENNHLFWGDQDILSEILNREKIPVSYLPEKYNCLMYKGLQLGAKIFHWAAPWGKDYIKNYGGMKKQMNRIQKGIL